VVAERMHLAWFLVIGSYSAAGMAVLGPPLDVERPSPPFSAVMAVFWLSMAGLVRLVRHRGRPYPDR